MLIEILSEESTFQRAHFYNWKLVMFLAGLFDLDFNLFPDYGSK